MQLGIFILLLSMLIGIASFNFVLFMSIQPTQWLDSLFNWQKKLRDWDISGTKNGMILSKILGYCELCFSHFVAFIGFWITLAVVLVMYDLNFPIWLYFVWYLMQVSISTNLNLYFITKLFK